MNCRTAQQLITDAVTGDLSDPRRDELVAHCDGCVSCRADWEALGVLWGRMGRSRVPAPASDLAERFAGRLSVVGRPAGRPWSGPWAVAAAVALLLIGGISGFAIGRLATTDVPTSDSASPAYLLLLYGEIEAPRLTNTQLIAEYARWAERLRTDGRLIEAHRLLDPIGTVEQRQVRPTRTAGVDAVSGFFLIHADDLGNAVQVALEGPHARYGGRIEVRPVAQ